MQMSKKATIFARNISTEVSRHYELLSALRGRPDVKVQTFRTPRNSKQQRDGKLPLLKAEKSVHFVRLKYLSPYKTKYVRSRKYGGLKRNPF